MTPQTRFSLFSSVCNRSFPVQCLNAFLHFESDFVDRNIGLDIPDSRFYVV